MRKIFDNLGNDCPCDKDYEVFHPCNMCRCPCMLDCANITRTGPSSFNLSQIG